MSRSSLILCLVLSAVAAHAQSYAELRAHIVSEEGYRSRQYLVRGRPHIGIGHLVTKPTGPLTHYQIEALFASDLRVACLVAYENTAHFSRHPKSVRILLVSLAFTVGPSGFRDFRRFRSAIDAYDYRGAARELRMSLWAQQLPERAARYDAILLSAAH